jgi:hypothetical protein
MSVTQARQGQGGLVAVGTRLGSEVPLEELLDSLLLLHRCVLGVEQLQHVVRALVAELGGGGEPAAIDHDVGPGDVRGLVAGQEEGGVADLLGLAAPA